MMRVEKEFPAEQAVLGGGPVEQVEREESVPAEQANQEEVPAEQAVLEGGPAEQVEQGEGVPAEQADREEVPAEQAGQEVPSFAAAEEMLRKRKREAEVGKTNDDKEEEDEDDKTSGRGLLCQDCGFQVHWLTSEDHQFCVGLDWICKLCECEVQTVSEERAHYERVHRDELEEVAHEGTQLH